MTVIWPPAEEDEGEDTYSIAFVNGLVGFGFDFGYGFGYGFSFGYGFGYSLGYGLRRGHRLRCEHQWTRRCTQRGLPLA